MSLARKLIASFAVTLALGAAAHAQDLAECKAVWKSVETDLISQDRPKIARLSDEWCMVDRLAPKPGDGKPTVELRQLAWRGAALEAAFTKRALPLDFALQASGARITPVRHPAAAGNALSTSARPELDLAFQISRDAATGLLRLDGPNLDLPGDNFVRLISLIDGVKTEQGPVSFASIGLGNLAMFSIEIASDGRAGEQLMVLIAAFDSTGGKPWDKDARDAALAQIAALPESVIDSASRRALEEIAADMPRLRGTVQLSATATKKFPLTRFAALEGPGGVTDPASLGRVLDGLAITVTYDNAP